MKSSARIVKCYPLFHLAAESTQGGKVLLLRFSRRSDAIEARHVQGWNLKSGVGAIVLKLRLDWGCRNVIRTCHGDEDSRPSFFDSNFGVV